MDWQVADLVGAVEFAACQRLVLAGTDAQITGREIEMVLAQAGQALTHVDTARLYTRGVEVNPDLRRGQATDLGL